MAVTKGLPFLERAKRPWLANPKDGAAAGSIEANPLEVGITRTRCVATMLTGGHAQNALPHLAEATVNCRIMPGVEPPMVQAPASPLRPDERLPVQALWDNILHWERVVRELASSGGKTVS